MIKKTYAEKLKDPRWQKVRLLILERDEWRCRFCGDDKNTLHVHHEKYFANPWDADLLDLKTCCKFCHSIIEHCKKLSYKVLHIERILQNDSFRNVFISFSDGMAVLIFSIAPLLRIESSLHKSAIDRFHSILKSF